MIPGTPISTVTYGYTDSSWKDLLTSYNGITISSDASGNPLNWRNASSLTWNGRKLTGLTLTDNTAVTYSYNSDGIRTEKTVGTRHTEYLLDGTKVLKQITTDISDNNYYEQILFYYDVNEELVGFHYDLHDYWYGKDINGVILYVYNELGEICAEYTYDAWGGVISSVNVNGGTVADVNPFRYKDYYFDTETGFYYLQSRYYDPTVARFISSDSVDYLGASGSVLSYNLFAYCENEPVMYSDPTGYLAANVVGTIVGLIIGAVGGYLLTRWLADKLSLSGWKRNVFIVGLTAVISASAAAIGYFVGPYVAKAWSYISARLTGLVKGSYKTIARFTEEKMKHINVEKHLWNRVLGGNATNTQNLIYQAIKNGSWGFDSNGVLQILWQYKGQIIVVTGKVIDGVLKISDGMYIRLASKTNCFQLKYKNYIREKYVE